MPCSCCGGGDPGPCCKMIPGTDVCGGIYTCENVSLQECCESSLPASSCSGGNLVNRGLVTGCTPNGGRKPSSLPPFNCANGAYRNGAYITVSGYNVGGAFDPVAATVESLINNTFFMPVTGCFIPAGRNFDFTVPVSTSNCRFGDTKWRVSVRGFYLCPPQVELQVYTFAAGPGLPQCWYPSGVDYDVYIEQYDYPCRGSSGLLCDCVAFEGFSSNNITPGNGYIQVTPA